MVQRGTLIAVLVGIELALVVMMIQAVHPGNAAPWHAAAMRGFHGPIGHERSRNGSSKYAFTAGANPSVTVDIAYADLTIERGDAQGITVDVPRAGWHGFGSSAPPITARQQGDGVIVSAPHGSWTFSDDRMVTIAVSPGTRVTVQNAGNITATGLRADASFNSNNGTVTVDDFNAPSLHVATSNGRLRLHNIVAPRFDVSSGNGGVDGTALLVRDGRVDSSNGQISLGFVRRADTLVSASSINGRVSVMGFNVSDAVAPAAAKAGAGDRDGDENDAGSAPAKTVRIGAGSGRLDVHASNGNINLSQEG
jgi:hypothetical protein